MDQDTRSEIDKLHGRVSDLKERVVNLEAQHPHINSSLSRIEKNVDRISGHFSKAVWILLGLFFAAVFKLVTSGSIPGV